MNSLYRKFIQDDIGYAPLNGKSRIYYYLSEINFFHIYLPLLIKPKINMGGKNIFTRALFAPSAKQPLSHLTVAKVLRQLFDDKHLTNFFLGYSAKMC